jgi:hypothetical protein
MLRLAFDRKNRVLQVTVSGIFASEDLEALDRAVLEFVAREGQVRSIYDYSAVQAFAVPQSRIVLRAQQPAIVREERVMVTSPAARGDDMRVYSRYQREAGQREPIIVDSVEEAYTVLRLRNPRFEPVER